MGGCLSSTAGSSAGLGVPAAAVTLPAEPVGPAGGGAAAAPPGPSAGTLPPSMEQQRVAGGGTLLLGMTELDHVERAATSGQSSRDQSQGSRNVLPAGGQRAAPPLVSTAAPSTTTYSLLAVDKVRTAPFGMVRPLGESMRPYRHVQLHIARTQPCFGAQAATPRPRRARCSSSRCRQSTARRWRRWRRSPTCW